MQSIREKTSYKSNKILERHFDRKAVVYVRQSSPKQILENTESTKLQYDLRKKAVYLGWDKQLVEIIDDDQGKSAHTAEGRFGFQKLLAQIGLDRVGEIV